MSKLEEGAARMMAGLRTYGWARAATALYHQMPNVKAGLPVDLVVEDSVYRVRLRVSEEETTATEVAELGVVVADFEGGYVRRPHVKPGRRTLPAAVRSSESYTMKLTPAEAARLERAARERDVGPCTLAAQWVRAALSLEEG